VKLIFNASILALATGDPQWFFDKSNTVQKTENPVFGADWKMMKPLLPERGAVMDR